MSFRYYRRFVLGNPQRRIFLPNFWMKLVPNEVEKPSNFVQFICPLEMTDRDIKNYLEKIYKVPVINVRSVARDAKIVRGEKGEMVKREDDYRSAFVQLSKDVKFEYPDLFPEEKAKEEKEEHKKIMQNLERTKEQYKERFLKNKSTPEWFQS